MTTHGHAQTLDAIDLGAALKRATEQRGGTETVPSPLDVGKPSLAPERSALGEGAAGRAPEPKSRVELDYARRLRNAMPADAYAAPPPARSRAAAEGAEQPPAAEDGMPRQFGYDQLRGRNAADQAPLPALSGAVDTSYRLGVGDEIIITFRGQRNNAVRTRVDRDGRVIIPDLPPISAQGRLFGAFREELESRVAASFPQTEVFVSVGAVRTVGVYVVGEVERPGIQYLNGLSSVLDAIAGAGGVRKTGSLREVQVVRDGRTRTIDLYDVVLGGRVPGDLTIAEGDRIVLKPLASTLAVVGEVRRPGIFELRSGRIAVQEAVALAGGQIRPEGYRYIKIAVGADGRDVAVEIDPAAKNVTLGNGEVLILARTRNSEIGGFLLDGHVAATGVRALQAEPTIGAVVKDTTIFKDNPYLLFAALQTTDPRTMARYYVPVNLVSIMEGGADVRLHQNDRLIVFSMADIDFLTSADVQAVLTGNVPPSLAAQLESAQQANTMAAGGAGLTAADALAARRRQMLAGVAGNGLASGNGGKAQAAATVCGGLKVLAAQFRTGRRERFANAIQAVADRPSEGGATPAAGDSASVPNVMPCPKIFEDYPDLLPFTLDYAVALQGEVRRPGAYPVLSGTPMDAAVAVAGGLAREVDIAAIEVTRFNSERDRITGGATRLNIDGRSSNLKTVALQPGDIVRFNPQFANRDVGPVVLRGEVKRPGLYNIYRGERLSELIARAGGLTDEAYPLGAVFGRKSVREQEAQTRRTLIGQLQSGLAHAALVGATEGKTEADSSRLSAVQNMIAAAQQAPLVGRIVVEADPSVLMVRPELDTVLEPGDELTIPKRPNHVSIAGEVLHPGAQQFDSNLDAATYIEQAGGFTQMSDKSRVYAVLPNGQARPLSLSSWNFRETHLPPGSTIVVPVDTMPFSGSAFAKDVLDALSKVAITAASLAVIAR